MIATSKKEFYGDQLVNNFRTVLGGFLKIFWGLIVLTLATIVFGLIIGGDSVAGHRENIMQMLTNESGQLMKVLNRLFFVWLFLTFLPLLPVLLLLARTFVFLPRKTFTLSGTSAIEYKERINRPRRRRAYEIQIRHPSGQPTISVRIDKKNYERLHVGDLVQVYYHPSDNRALYVVFNENTD